MGVYKLKAQPTEQQKEVDHLRPISDAEKEAVAGRNVPVLSKEAQALQVLEMQV